MRVTREMLEKVGATCTQVRVFADEWPDGMEVTRESLQRARELRLGVEWAAGRILPPKLRATYSVALELAQAAHAEAMGQARDADAEAVEEARGAYDKAVITAVLDAMAAVRGRDEPVY